MKLKCVVIDDEPRAIHVVETHIQKIPFLEIAAVFRNGLEALEFLQDHQVDLLFLDINMPDLSGIQFMNSLTRPPMVIFTTAYSEFALESYEYNAVDFLLKPIEFERFLKAANKAMAKMQTLSKPQQNLSNGSSVRKGMQDTLFIKSGQETYQLKINDILYVESAGNYVNFVTRDDQIMTLMTMHEVLEILPEHFFFRVHRSYIIARKYIDKIERHQVHIGNKKVPIGSIYRNSFLKEIKE